MLKLSKKADYGLIALRHLAMHQPGASARAIPGRYGLPLALLSKVLQRLARKSLLGPVQGTTGGYRLARDPSRIGALEVILAIDGPVTLAPCFDKRGRCMRSPRCAVRGPLRSLHQGILQLLGGIMIVELLEQPEDQMVRTRTASLGPTGNLRHAHRGPRAAPRSGNEKADLPG